jgi:hypothetical protein
MWKRLSQICSIQQFFGAARRAKIEGLTIRLLEKR